MGGIIFFTETAPGGTPWYGATYPLGATRYYASVEGRERAARKYVDAIAESGGLAYVVRDAQVR